MAGRTFSQVRYILGFSNMSQARGKGVFDGPYFQNLETMKFISQLLSMGSASPMTCRYTAEVLVGWRQVHDTRMPSTRRPFSLLCHTLPILRSQRRSYTRYRPAESRLSMNLDHPPTLYRVQHADSFTHYGDSSGFMAQVDYPTDYCHWFNREKVLGHLIWSDRPVHPTPFISLFNSFCMLPVLCLR